MARESTRSRCGGTGRAARRRCRKRGDGRHRLRRLRRTAAGFAFAAARVNRSWGHDKAGAGHAATRKARVRGRVRRKNRRKFPAGWRRGRRGGQATALKAVGTPAAAAARGRQAPAAPAAPARPRPRPKRAGRRRRAAQGPPPAALASFLLARDSCRSWPGPLFYFRAEPEYHRHLLSIRRSEDTGAARSSAPSPASAPAAREATSLRYIRSQEIVAAIDQKIDLRAI